MFSLLLLTALALADACAAAPYKPIFHITAPGRALSGASGPYRDPATRLVHLYARLGANASWHHLTSKDYARWARPAAEAALPNDRWYDAWGATSGALMGSGGDGRPVAMYTCVEEGGARQQCIATPARRGCTGQPDLGALAKSPLNPVITDDNLPGLIGPESFRDPTGWWQDPQDSGRWLVAFAARLADAGCGAPHVVVFATRDSSFQGGYSYSHSLYAGTGGDEADTFEHPDFFAVPGAAEEERFLKISDPATRRDYVVYGAYEPTTSSSSSSGSSALQQYVFTRSASRGNTLVDLGSFYGARTFHDPTLNRRMVVGRIAEDPPENSTAATVAPDLDGVIALRAVKYDGGEGRLRFPPLPELRALRSRRLLRRQSVTLTAVRPTVELVASTAAATRHQEIVTRFQLPAGLFDGAAHHRSLAPELGLMVRMSANRSRYVAVALQMPLTNATPTRAYAQREYPFRTIDLSEDSNAVGTCEGVCLDTPLCAAWEIRYQPFADVCTLFWQLGTLVDSVGSVSGRPNEPILTIRRNASGTLGATRPLNGRAPLPSTATATAPGTVELRVFVDDSVIKVFKDDGLQVLTGRVYLPAQADGDALTSIGLYMRNVPGPTLTLTSRPSRWGPSGRTPRTRRAWSATSLAPSMNLSRPRAAHATSSMTAYPRL